MKALLAFAPLYALQWKRLAMSLGLAAITLLAGLLLLGVSGWFLTAAALTTAAASFNLFGPSSLIRGLSLVRILSRYGEKIAGHDATLRLLADLRGWLFGRLFPRLPIADRSLAHGDLVSRLTADIDALDTVFLVAIGPFLTAILIALVVSLLLIAVAPAAAAIYVVALGLAIFAVPVLLVVCTRRLGAESVVRSAAARVAVLQGIEGHKDFVAFGQVDLAEQNLARVLNDLSASKRHLAFRGASASAAIQALAGAALVGVLWFGIAAYRQGAIDAPWLVGLLLATIASFEAANAIVRSVARFSAAIAAAGRIHALADGPVAVVEISSPKPLPASSDLEFRDVGFAYPAQKHVLGGINLTIEAGQRVAIIGPSGSGKSTLLSLLVRLHDPLCGTITFGGVDIKQVSLADLRSRISLMTQESHVFMGTIRDNLLIGNDKASDAELWQALSDVRLADLVRALPGGLDAYVGEFGATLSVGQARRLCLARSLLSKADIMLFDEPTSGLDRQTELAFLGDLVRLTTNRTVVISTHAALPEGSVDIVCNMRDGEISATDPFRPLTSAT
jgi:ATP-binding cassette subfamily C protein CydC